MLPATDLRKVTEIIERYLESADAKSTPLKIKPLKELVDALQVEKWVEQGGLHGEEWEKFLPLYLDASINLRHPHNMNHQVSVPVTTSGSAGAINGMLSNPMNIYEMGPAAASLEFFLINYFLGIIGWQPQPYPHEDQAQKSGGGVLTHGGSLSNLTALVAARSHWQRNHPSPTTKPIILTSDVSHYSNAKAAFIMGLECRAVVSDEQGRMQPQSLLTAIKESSAKQESIVAVVASACNTPVGYFDPLPELAAVCAEHKLWLHIDGAHGASLLLSPKYKQLLQGIDLADSITWDAHKMLRTQGICTMLLVRERINLDSAYQQEASYLFHDKEQLGFDFMGRSFECTKAGMGFNFFHALAYQGIDAVGDYVTGLCDTTAMAFDALNQGPFHCAVEPQCNILCFRPTQEMDEKTILHLRDQLMRDGYPISSTLFKGHRWLRLTIMSPNTQVEHIQGLKNKLLRLCK